MILTSISEDDGTWVGQWRFDALPSIGEHFVLAGDRYLVLDVEHWPVMAVQTPTSDIPTIKIRVNPRPFPSQGMGQP